MSPILLGVSVLSIVVAQAKISDESLFAAQKKMMVRIEDPGTNRALYDYFEAHPIQGKIISAYAVLGLLPELSDHYLNFPCNNTAEWVTPPADAKYLFMAPFCSSTYKKEVARLEETHYLKRQYELKNYILFEIQ
jgi:hypothetical protein